MQLGELFSKTLRVDRPFGVLASGWRRFLPKGRTASRNWTCWSRRWRLRPYRITEVSEGGSAPFSAG